MTKDGYARAYQQGFHLTVGFLVSRGVRRDSADDVAQAAWVRGWERLAQLRNESLVVTWVNTIALNLYLSLVRKEQMTQGLIDQPDQRAAIDLAAIDLSRILSRCRPADRDLLEQYMHGVTTAEMARKEGASQTAIRIRLLRARRQARSHIEPKDLTQVRSGNLYVIPKKESAVRTLGEVIYGTSLAGRRNGTAGITGAAIVRG